MDVAAWTWRPGHDIEAWCQQAQELPDALEALATRLV
jgi:hypothetical protein